MNLLLSLLLTIQKPKVSQPPTSQGWEIALVVGGLIGTTIFKYGVQNKEPQSLTNKYLPQTINIPTQTITTAHAVNTPLTVNTDYLTIGQRIIDELVSSKLSTLLAAPSGAGKSVTQAYWLTKLFEKFPQANVYVVARKNDSFNGLREQGKVSVYDSANSQSLVDAINKVYKIFQERSQMPEGIEREKLKDKPVRLILADWYSTHNSLIKTHKKLWDSEIQTKLADIVTVAREFNVSLFADSQTYNIASLGLAEDSNIRNNLNIISQGLISFDEYELEQGGFEVMQTIIKSQYIFPDERLREKFASEFLSLIEISNQQHIPAILSTSGKPKAGLLPNLMKYKAQAIRFEKSTPTESPENAISTAQLTAMSDDKANAKTDANTTQKPINGELTATAVLPEPLRTIWNVVKKKGDWLTARDIARSEYAALRNQNTAAEIIGFVNQLEKLGLLEVDNSGQSPRFRIKP